MKKLIIVIMALITIFSASVSAFASQTFVDWQIVDTILNVEYSSTNCKVIFFNSDTPDVNWVDVQGRQKFQKTTFSVLLDMFEVLTVDGASLSANAVFPQVYEWYVYGGYCFIRITVEGNISGNVYDGFWVGNGSGKILYCDAPASETTYTISAIAGATGYCLTDRPAGTSGNGYLGDLRVSQDNLTTIHGLVSNLGGAADYYTVLRIIDGEYRYYIMCTYPNRTQYFVCNTSGQLYYALKDEPDNGGSGSGSSFDATEVITAINSVYDAVDIGFYSVCRWLDAIQDNISSFNTDVLIMSQNMTNGFVDLRNVGNTINTTLSTINSNLLYTGDNITSSFDTFRTRFEDYFESLGKSYPVLTTVKLSGEDNLFPWSDGDIVQSFTYDVLSSSDDSNDGVGSIVINGIEVFRGFHGNDGFGIDPASVFFSSSAPYKSSVDQHGNLEITCIAPNGYDRYYYQNFCKNFDFRSPANSLGNTVYSANGLTLDGWYLLGTSSIVSVADGYVNYSVINATNYNHFYYPLSISYSESSTYTISLLARINSTSGYCRFRPCSGTSGLSGGESWGYDLATQNGMVLISETFTAQQDYSNAGVEFIVGADSSLDIDIIAVKVEANKWQTLAFSDDTVGYCLFSDIYTPISDVRLYPNSRPYDLSVSLSFCKNGHDKIFYNRDLSKWQVYRYLDGVSTNLSDSDQSILNNYLFSSPQSRYILLSDVTVDSFNDLFYDGVNTVDITGDVVVTIDYYHTGTWFEYVYFMMDKLYERIGQVDGAVVNIENTVVDIVQDNDAFNIFYVEKTDGTTESVGDVTIDAAKFVGEFLSIFYRLVFEDAFSNSDIIRDFEDVYTDNNVGVSVW